MSSFISGPGEFYTSDVNNPQITFKGLSTDTKPSATTWVGRLFIETDTGNVYVAYGGIWNLVSAAGGSGGWSPSKAEPITNKTIDSGLNTVKESMNASAYVYIDSNDGNKIKGRMNSTGVIYSHATNADVVLQAVIDDLSTGSTIGTVTTPVPGAGDNYHLWSGGKYGSISVGPGTFYFYKYVILKSNIKIEGAGKWATVFTMPDNLYNVSHNDNTIGIFKSSMWDTNSIGGGIVTTEALQRADVGITLRDFTIYGNWRNNVIPATNTATTNLVAGVETAGTDSWGHGIALYAFGCVIDNVNVHGCPGAGIIIQNHTTTLGSGWPYPAFGGNGSGQADGVNYITNCRCWANGRQGILGRSNLYISNYWSFVNGEAGIDFQQCGYFNSSAGWIEGIECFLDGQNHPGPTLGQASTTYDPLGFECRLSGWVSDAWIEAPAGCGDNLAIGHNGTGVTGTPTNYQLWATGYSIQGTNMYLDYVRHSGIFISPNTRQSWIRGTIVAAVNNGTSTYVNITPLTLTGNFQDIDLIFTGFNSTAFSGGSSATGVVLGDSVLGAATWCNLKLFSDENDYVIDNQNAGNVNSINATVVSRGGVVTTFLKPGGAALSSNNTINVTPITNNAYVGRSQNGGTATFSGNGSTTVFTIAHKLFAAPTVLSIFPQTADARGNPSATVDATNITVTYPVAPPTGTNNVILWWNARVSP